MIAEEYEILQLEWDYRIVQDQSGKKKKYIINKNWFSLARH